METVPFEHDGRHYEIRIVSNGDTIFVRTFYDNQPANGYTYQVSLPVAVDFSKALGKSAIQELVETAKNDVVSGAWERLLKALGVKLTPNSPH